MLGPDDAIKKHKESALEEQVSQTRWFLAGCGDLTFEAGSLLVASKGS
jgi:hypothetical protein